MSRAAKLLVVSSDMAAIYFLAWLVSGGIPSILLPTFLAFASGLAGALLAGDVAASIVLGLVYAVPALSAWWFGAFYFSYYAIWLAAMLGAMLPRAVSGWCLPEKWRLPIMVWALSIALVWPIIALREVDFVPALIFRGDLWNSRLGLFPGMAEVWIASVTAIALTGLLLLDWIAGGFAADLDGFERRVIRPIFAGAVIAAAGATYQSIVDMSFLNQTSFGAYGRAVGTLRDANAFGMIAAIWTPIAIVRACQVNRERRGRLAAALATSVVLVVGVWASGSRTALLSVIVAAIVFIWARGRSMPRRRAALLIGSFAIAFGVLAVAAPRTTGPLRRIAAFLPGFRPSQLAFAANQLLYRDMYGHAADRMIAEHPVVGVGVGNFNYQYADVLFQMGVGERPPDNAQNWYRQQLAELGIAGSAGWIAWTVLFGALIVRRWRKDDQRLTAVKGAILGVAAASLVGMPAQDAAVSVTFIVAVAWYLLASLRDPEEAKRALVQRAFDAKIATVVLVAFLGGTLYAARHGLRPPERARRSEYAYRYGFTAFDERNTGLQWTGKRAVTVFPVTDRYVGLTIGSVAPDVEQHPIEVKIWRNGVLAARLTRHSAFPIERWFRLPDGQHYAFFEIEVSRTWQPAPGVPSRGVSIGNWTFAYWTPKGAVVIE